MRSSQAKLPAGRNPRYPARAQNRQPNDLTSSRISLHENGVGFFEALAHSFAFEGLLEQRLGIPFAARHTKKIPAVHVKCTGEPRKRIADGVNDVATERHGIFFAERAGAGRFEFTARRARDTPPENIVLASGVDADYCPHLMIMR